MHEALGVIDVSTLGKIVVEGPGRGRAARPALPEPLLRPEVGRIRYGVLTTDGGRIMDDGTVARLGDDALLRHDDLDRLGQRLRVVRVVERDLGLRRRDRQRHGRTGRRQSRRPAGARGACGADRGRRLERGVRAIWMRKRDSRRRRAVPRAPDRVRGRARVRAALRRERRRAPLGRARRVGRGAVRARAAAGAPAREGAT